MPKVEKAVFLDRDGTLNEDPGYLSDPNQLRVFPGVAEALATLKKAGFSLVVVTNQSGVARGLIQLPALEKIHLKLNQELGPQAAIDHFESCFHLPEAECACRKPKPGMILKTCQELSLDVSQSFMIGDRLRDLQSGEAAGCRGLVLVRTGNGAEEEPKVGGVADFIAANLSSAAEWILSQR